MNLIEGEKVLFFLFALRGQISKRLSWGENDSFPFLEIHTLKLIMALTAGSKKGERKHFVVARKERNAIEKWTMDIS